MDGLQTAVTTLAIIAIILLVLLLACHYIGPRASAWFRSNREEKIGLSKSKLYNANGYLIHSGSDILLSSRGSFKRFDSIDSDFKQVGQTTSTVASPPWNSTQNDIPPQPLRPAPAPAPTTKERKKSVDKQQSLEVSLNLNTVIPRPITKRQHSTPINLSEAVVKMAKAPRSCTNPFLNGTLSIPESDNPNLANTVFYEESSFCKFESEKLPASAPNNPFSIATAYRDTSPKGIVTKEFEDDFAKKTVDSKNYFNYETTTIETMMMNDRNLHSSNESMMAASPGCKSHRSDASDMFQQPQQDPPFTRNRSLSETEAGDTVNVIRTITSTNPFCNNNNNNNRTSLHKTLSETYLEQYTLPRSSRSMSQQWNSYGRNFSRQNSSSSLTARSLGGSQFSVDGDGDGLHLQRAMSCDSVNSESSVVLADLETIQPPVTGHLCVGLQYDKNSITEEGAELVVSILEAKELIGPQSAENLDTFVRVYLVPDETGALQTKLFKNSPCPSYNEKFCFWLNKKRTRRSLWFHLYHSGNAHTLIGEAEMQIGDVTRPVTTWLALSDSRHNTSNWGDLMFSLSYLPTAERLTVVVVKARNLSMDEHRHTNLQNVFVKVYLLKNDKKVSKKKTSTKRSDRCPIYNESMIFSVPPYVLNSIQIRLTVVNATDASSDPTTRSILTPVGHVIVGKSTSGKGLRHYNQMLSALRKPVAMWHSLRRTVKNKSEVTT